jgi:hypothetical protein
VSKRQQPSAWQALGYRPTAHLRERWAERFGEIALTVAVDRAVRDTGIARHPLFARMGESSTAAVHIGLASEPYCIIETGEPAPRNSLVTTFAVDSIGSHDWYQRHDLPEVPDPAAVRRYCETIARGDGS